MRHEETQMYIDKWSSECDLGITFHYNLSLDHRMAKAIQSFVRQHLEYGIMEYGNVEYGNVEYGNVEYGNVEYGNVEYGNVEYGTHTLKGNQQPLKKFEK